MAGRSAVPTRPSTTTGGPSPSPAARRSCGPGRQRSPPGRAGPGRARGNARYSMPCPSEVLDQREVVGNGDDVGQVVPERGGGPVVRHPGEAVARVEVLDSTVADGASVAAADRGRALGA